MKRRRHNQDTENSAMMPAGNAAIRRKPIVGGVNSPSEHRVDAMADKVMQMPEAPFDRPKTSTLGNRSGLVKPFTQARDTGEGMESEVVSGKIKAYKGSGSPMADTTKSFMESRFGNDFSNVRIHTGDYAAKMSNELNARAFTVGSDIYFNSGKYAPEASEGKHLLAHELTHVEQQNDIGPKVQRALVTGAQSTASAYKLDDWNPKQVKTGQSSAFPEAKLSYDEGSSDFTVTFSLAWIFPHIWDDAKRKGYVNNFEKAISDNWDDRFLLTEPKDKKRSTHVHIDFDENIVFQGKNANDESAALNAILMTKQAWMMDTRITNVRDNVNFRTVQLDENANKNHSSKGSAIRAGSSFSVNDGNDNTTFTQNTSAHEFGHMIGLGDEYLNDSGTAANQIDPARAHINSRIMNVGNTVTADVYAPFADWLSALTSTTWIVGAKVK
jgi:hypothetical protein